MNKKRNLGKLLILIGFGIPLVLLFFQTDGELVLKDYEEKTVRRKLNTEEIKAVKKLREKLTEFQDETSEAKYFKWKFESYVNNALKNQSEIWDITIGDKISLAYGRIVGIGIFIIFIGIGFLIVSPKPQKIKQEK